jgi:uncharacterized membrane protein
MRRIWISLAAALGIAVFIGIGGEVVMHLWNWNLPAVFGWREITFWQAIGLFALCRILFGDLGMLARGSQRSTFRRRMAERWGQMTPEEREKFRQGMRSRCGDFAAPTGRTPAGETRGPA